MSNEHSALLPFVSVIVPVRDDALRLRQCLDALTQQTYPADRYEIVVVDSGSREPVAPLVAAYAGTRTVVETLPGPARARNAGIRAAKGEVFAFTDSDCIPQPHWIEQGVAAFQANSDVSAVGGRMSIFYRDPERPTVVEEFEGLTAFPQQHYIEQVRFSVTANLFAQRSVFDVVGPFNVALEFAEDVEWGQRVAAAGLLLSYCPTAEVLHPARATLNELLYKTRRTVNADYPLKRHQGWSRRRLLLDALREFVPPVRFMLAVLANPQRPLRRRVAIAAVRLAEKYTRGWVRLSLVIRDAVRPTP